MIHFPAAPGSFQTLCRRFNSRLPKGGTSGSSVSTEYSRRGQLGAPSRLPNNAKDMRGLDPRAQSNKVAPAAPGVLTATQKIFNKKSFPGQQIEAAKIQIGPAGLLVKSVKFDGDENRVLEIRRGFGVAEQIGVVDIVEVERPVGLQSGVGVAHPVERGHQRNQ